MNKLYTNAPGPLDLSSIDAFLIILSKTSIDDGSSFLFCDGYLTGSTTITGSIIPNSFCSNIVTGKKLSVLFDGANLGAGPNTIEITGTTYSGATNEVFSITGISQQISTEYWLTITSIDISITRSDTNLPAGVLSISESISITKEENSGTCAEVSSWDNGVISFIIKGTANDFELRRGSYLIDYPNTINIPYSKYGEVSIGSSYLDTNYAEAIIETPALLNIMLSDIRVGEDSSDELNFTSLFNSPIHPKPNENHTILMELDNKISIKNDDYVSFNEKYHTSHNSVNTNFGESLIVENSFFVESPSELISTKAGSIEFWISPIHDTWESDGQDRFIFDISNISTIEIKSLTRDRIFLPEKVKKVIRVYQKSDTSKTNLLSYNSLQKDNQTIFLSKALPKVKTDVIVDYQSTSSDGDRMQLYIDGYTQLNFNIISSGKTLTISRNINWKRNSWHKILCSWNLSNSNNLDRIRMFVDGIEYNVITWGNIVWGDGSVWGQTDLEDNVIYGKLEELEPMTSCVFGSDYSGSSKYPFRLDNLRFSSIARQPTRIGNKDYDLSYNSNLEYCFPVIPDANTNAIFDFNKNTQINTKTANLLKREAPLYSIGVEIDDGFSKLENERVKKILSNIYQKLKPAHMQLYSSIIQDKE